MRYAILVVVLVMPICYAQTSSVGSHAVTNTFRDLVAVAPECQTVIEYSTALGPTNDKVLDSVAKCKKQADDAIANIVNNRKEISLKQASLKSSDAKATASILAMAATKQALIINLELDLLITSMQQDLCRITSPS